MIPARTPHQKNVLQPVVTPTTTASPAAFPQTLATFFNTGRGLPSIACRALCIKCNPTATQIIFRNPKKIMNKKSDNMRPGNPIEAQSKQHMLPDFGDCVLQQVPGT
jgi:hypothetical protein